MAFDHSSRTTKAYKPEVGFCVCRHCRNLPEHEPMPLSPADQTPKIRRMYSVPGKAVRQIGFDPAGGSAPQKCYVLAKLADGSYQSYLDVPYAIVLAVLNAVDVDAAFERWIAIYYRSDTINQEVLGILFVDLEGSN